MGASVLSAPTHSAPSFVSRLSKAPGWATTRGTSAIMADLLAAKMRSEKSAPPPTVDRVKHCVLLWPRAPMMTICETKWAPHDGRRAYWRRAHGQCPTIVRRCALRPTPTASAGAGTPPLRHRIQAHGRRPPALGLALGLRARPLARHARPSRIGEYSCADRDTAAPSTLHQAP